MNEIVNEIMEHEKIDTKIKEIQNRIINHQIHHRFDTIFDFVSEGLLDIKELVNDANTEKEECTLHFVSPRLFYVVNHAQNDGEEFMEQLSVGLDTYEDAVKFRDSDYYKKKDPNCFILCSINEG